MGHGIEKALDIRIQHPVHLLPVNPGVESVQRIMLAAPRSESVREAEKILLVDGLQNVHDCLLDDTRGRGGWLDLPRGGLAPPILCQLSWRTPDWVQTLASAGRWIHEPVS